MSATTETELSLQIKEAHISESEATVLQTTFAPHFQKAEEWRIKAHSIQVTNIADKPQMKEAREIRLALKEIRIDVEKTRKELKEESLRKGKAIDCVANIIKGFIAPLEEHLERQENFIKIEEEKAKAVVKAKRETELQELGVDVSLFNLSDMEEEKYQKVLQGSHFVFNAKKEADRKAEEERVERERVETESRERMRLENERLKKEAAEKEVELTKERLAKEVLESDMRAKKQEEDRVERENRAIEEKRLELEKHARLAPDKEKLVGFADNISSIKMPDVSSAEAKVIVQNAILLLAKVSQYIRTQSINL